MARPPKTAAPSDSPKTPPAPESTPTPITPAQPPLDQSNTAAAMYGESAPGKPIEFSPFAQLGRSGLKEYAGFVLEEFLPTLRGAQGAKAYREILDNCPLVAGIFRQIQLSMRQVEKYVEPFSEDDEDVKRAERIEQALDDMSDSWEDVTSEAATMIPYGYAPMEITYKKCGGWTDDPKTRSRYDDGLITWRKVALRAQDTLFRWEFDSDGGVKAMLQLPPPDFVLRTIPIEKMLLFRPSVEKGNPEGYSCFRSSYFNWIMVKNLTEFEAIKGERDATGVPVVWTPAENLGPSPTPVQRAALAFAKKTAKGIKVDDQQGVVMPLAYDKQNNKVWDLTLLSESGKSSSGFDYDKVITRHETRIAISLLAGAAMLGHDKVGSFALANTKWETELAMGLSAWLDAMFAVWNRHAIPRLYALNGWPMDRMAQMRHGEVKGQDIEMLAQSALWLSQAGMDLFPDENLENHIRREAGWPELVDGQFEEREAQNDADAQQAAMMHGHRLPGVPGAMANPDGTQGAPRSPAGPGGQQGGGGGKPGSPQGAPGKGGQGTGKPATGAKPIRKRYGVRGKGGTFSPRSAAAPAPERHSTVTDALRLLRDRARVGKGVDDIAHGFTSVSSLPLPSTLPDWRQGVETAPLERISLKGLIATQETVRRDSVRNFVENPNAVPPGQRAMTGEHVDLPVVMNQNGKRYILDGHHRLTAKALLGYPDVVARVIDGNLPANAGQPLDPGGK